MLKLNKRTRKGSTRGQAMVEYVLIAVLVSLAIAAVITVTGPTIGNIFSNTVYNLMGMTSSPGNTFGPSTIQYYANQLSQFSPPPPDYSTNTPAVPTCANVPGKYAPTLGNPAPAGTYVVDGAGNCS